jgi:hypothetical protein
MRKERNMFRFKRLFVFCLSGVLSLSTLFSFPLDVKGYEICINSSGSDCVVYTTVGSFKRTVVRYTQNGISTYLKNEAGTDCIGINPEKDYKIWYYGCAITSVTMLVNYYYGYTSTKGILISDVNSTVHNSCNYNPTNVVVAYSTVLELVLADNNYDSNSSRVIDKVSAYFISNSDRVPLILIGAQTSAGLKHFELAIGYTYTDFYYESGRVERDFTDIIMLDPNTGTSHTRLSQFMLKYPTVYRIHVYGKK